MTKLEHSVVIEAPIKEVFDYASDWRKWEDWFDGVYNFEALTKSEKGNGTRYKYKAKMLMFKTTIVAEVYDYIENKSFKAEGIQGMPYKSFWTFEEINEKTKFTYGLEYSVSPPFIGPLLDSLFIRAQWKNILQRSLQNLSQKFNRQ